LFMYNRLSVHDFKILKKAKYIHVMIGALKHGCES